MDISRLKSKSKKTAKKSKSKKKIVYKNQMLPERGSFYEAFNQNTQAPSLYQKSNNFFSTHFFHLNNTSKLAKQANTRVFRRNSTSQRQTTSDTSQSFTNSFR